MKKFPVLLFLFSGTLFCGPPIDILDLMSKSKSRDREIAARARDTLDRYVLERRVSLFERALDSGTPEDRAMALWSLGRIGTPDAVAVLVGSLAQEKSFPLTMDLVKGLWSLQPEDSRLRIARLLREIGVPPGSVAMVRPALVSPDLEERLVGVYVLSIMRQAEAALDLVPLLQDPDPMVVKASVEALGQLRNPVTIPALIEKSLRLDSPARSTALTALSNFHDPRIVDALLASYISEADLGLRFKMASLLGKYPDRRVVSALIPDLRSADRNLKRIVETRLCELTHRRPGLPPEDWESWWKGKGESFEFPRRVFR